MFKPNTTVAWVITCKDKFLIVEEIDQGQVVYNQPAGHLEANESLQQAAIRELKEETGLSVKPEFLLGIYHNEVPNKDIQYLRFCYIAELSGELPTTKPTDSDIIAAKWLTIDEIKQLAPQHRSPMVMQCINDYLSGERYPLSLLKSYL